MKTLIFFKSFITFGNISFKTKLEKYFNPNTTSAILLFIKCIKVPWPRLTYTLLSYQKGKTFAKEYT